MPARCNHLNQDLALRDFRDLHPAFLIGLEAQLGEFLMVQEPSRHVVPDVNARVRDGLIVAILDLNMYLRGRRIRGLLLFLVRIAGRILRRGWACALFAWVCVLSECDWG